MLSLKLAGLGDILSGEGLPRVGFLDLDSNTLASEMSHSTLLETANAVSKAITHGPPSPSCPSVTLTAFIKSSLTHSAGNLKTMHNSLLTSRL